MVWVGVGDDTPGSLGREGVIPAETRVLRGRGRTAQVLVGLVHPITRRGRRPGRPLVAPSRRLQSRPRVAPRPPPGTGRPPTAPLHSGPRPVSPDVLRVGRGALRHPGRHGTPMTVEKGFVDTQVKGTPSVGSGGTGPSRPVPRPLPCRPFPLTELTDPSHPRTSREGERHPSGVRLTFVTL